MFNPDTWEAKYIANLKNKDLLAWDDEEAFHRYPKYNWVYDKLYLAHLTGVKAWDLETEMPDEYPVIVKPKTNFTGLSKDCYIADRPHEIEDHVGFIAQRVIKGQQYTADMYVKDGRVIEMYPFMTERNSYGEIIGFTTSPIRFDTTIKNQIEPIMKDYNGIINVEWINETIIEIHLRPSLQFFDICGGFIEAMPQFMEDGKPPSYTFEKTYSLVYRTRHDGKVTDFKLPLNKPDEIRSIQLAWEDDKPLSITDPSLFRKRYMIINGTNRDIINNFASQCMIKLEK